MQKVIDYLKKYYNEAFIIALSACIFIDIAFVVCKLTTVSSIFFYASFAFLILFLIVKLIILFKQNKFKDALKQKETILLIVIGCLSLLVLLEAIIEARINNVSITYKYLLRIFQFISCLIFLYLAVITKVNKTAIRIITYMDIALSAVFILGFAIGFARTKTDMGYTFNFGNPNTTAQIILVIITLLIIGIFLFKRIWISLIYIALAIAMIVFLFLTGSRSGLIALLVGLIFLIVVLFKKKIGNPHITTILMFVLVPFLLVLIYIPVYYLIYQTESLRYNSFVMSLSTRYGTWTDGFKFIMKNPIFGSYKTYQTYDHFHNTLLDTWANYGIFAFIGVIFVFTWAIKIVFDKCNLNSYYSRILISVLFMTYMTTLAEVAILNSANGSYILELLPLIFLKTPIEEVKEHKE